MSGQEVFWGLFFTKANTAFVSNKEIRNVGV